MGEKGETRDTMRKIPPRLDRDAVTQMIRDGRYVVEYDEQGLQQASSSNSNPDSTWYNFVIKNQAGNVVGWYHIHPNRGRFYSGNLHIASSNSFGGYMVGQARDWQGLCDQVKSQVS